MSPESVISDFTRRHNFVVPETWLDDRIVINWAHDINRSIKGSVASHAERLVANGDPSWAMIMTMLDRVYEHTAGALVSFFTGTWASMEVIVRTTIEAAVTVLYVTRSDRHARLGQYLTQFFIASRKAISMSDSAVQMHALKDLERRENIIRQVATLDGIPMDKPGWPSRVEDRFKAVGMETEYRHIYAVLSGQVHSDADALVDYVVVRSLAQHSQNVEALVSRELLYWMRFYLYSGILYYALAANSYASALELADSISETHQIEQTIAAHLQRLTDEFRQSSTDLYT